MRHGSRLAIAAMATTMLAPAFAYAAENDEATVVQEVVVTVQKRA